MLSKNNENSKSTFLSTLNVFKKNPFNVKNKTILRWIHKKKTNPKT